jgi:hypothetical protein
MFQFFDFSTQLCNGGLQPINIVHYHIDFCHFYLIDYISYTSQLHPQDKTNICRTYLGYLAGNRAGLLAQLPCHNRRNTACPQPLASCNRRWNNCSYHN